MADAIAVGVILASVRERRQGERVAHWFMAQLAERSELKGELLDLLAFPLPNYAHARPPKLEETHYSEPREIAWREAVSRQDAYVLVTPEYNHGYPPSLKNALDYLYGPWNRKPVAFVSYGGISGGTRAVQQLRQVVVELQMAPLRDEVNIPFVGKAFDPGGRPLDPLPAQRAGVLLDQLIWWARALNAARPSVR